MHNIVVSTHSLNSDSNVMCLVLGRPKHVGNKTTTFTNSLFELNLHAFKLLLFTKFNLQAQTHS